MMIRLAGMIGQECWEKIIDLYFSPFAIFGLGDMVYK